MWHYRDADPDFGSWQVGRGGSCASVLSLLACSGVSIRTWAAPAHAPHLASPLLLVVSTQSPQAKELLDPPLLICYHSLIASS